MADTFIESSLTEQDETFEVPLRPQTLTQFSGQDAIRERLDVLVGAAKQRKESLGHCLFTGPPGLGKTTLANILANIMGSHLVVTSGPIIEKAGDLAGVLTNLQDGDILFIDEIHRMNRTIEEYLYPAMEDFTLDLLIDSGPNARSVQVKLNRFTLVGATTRMGLLSSPLRSRFAFSCRLEYYDPKVLTKILLRASLILNIELDESSAYAIAKRSRGTPRIANNLLRWVRDYSQMRTGNVINEKVVHEALGMLSIDEKGLDEMDNKILKIIIDHYRGGPVGLHTLAVAVSEEPSTIEEVYEPFLILLGLIERTPRGRKATELAYKHLGRKNTRLYAKRHPDRIKDYYKNNKEVIKKKRDENRDEIIFKQRKWRKNLKLEVFTHYSKGKPKCNHCGYDDIRALCLDHINNDGAEQRRKIRPKSKHRGGNAIDVYINAKRNKFPKDLQVLCSNCNRIKEHKRINGKSNDSFNKSDCRRNISETTRKVRYISLR